MGNWGHHRAVSDNLIHEFLVLGRIHHVHTVSQYGDGAAAGFDGPALGRGVDAGRHAADDGDPASRQPRAKPFGHTDAVGTGAARAHDGHAMLVLFRKRSADEEHQGRIVDFGQQKGVLRILEGHHVGMPLVEGLLLGGHIGDVFVLAMRSASLGPTTSRKAPREAFRTLPAVWNRASKRMNIAVPTPGTRVSISQSRC